MIKSKIFFKNNKYELSLFVFFIVLSVIFILPFARHNLIYIGDDIRYNVNRIYQIAYGLKHGILISNMSTVTFTLNPGYIVNVFYPWLTILPFSLLYAISNQIVFSFYFGVFLYTITGLYITYYSTFYICKNRIQSIITSIIYTFSTYRITELYSRFAIGEWLAGLFLPMLLYGLYAIFYKQEKWYWLPVGMALIMYSHILSAILSVLVLIIFSILFIWSFENKHLIFIKLLQSSFIFLGLTIAFMGPFLEQYLVNDIYSPQATPLSTFAYNFSDLVIKSIEGNINSPLSGGLYGNIGFLLICSIFLFPFLFRQLSGIYRFSFLMGLVFFLMMTRYFPWRYLQGTTFDLIQFPFRLSLFSTVFLSFLGGREFKIILEKLHLSGCYKVAYLFIVIILVVSTFGYASFIFGRSTFANSYTVTNKFDDSFMFNELETKDYIPRKTVKIYQLVSEKKGWINGKKAKFKINNEYSNKITLRVNNLEKDQSIVLPVYSYRNMKVYQGHHELHVSTSKDGLIKVRAKTDGNFVVRYKMDIFDYWCYIVSVTCWFALLIYLFRKHLIKRWRSN